MKELWVEKYRPLTVEDYVFVDQSQKEQVMSWIANKSIPHLLLSGPAGTGKTTLAKLLIHSLGINEYDVMVSNGSKEARRIGWMETLINFCQTMPFGDLKVVLIDEADYMNKESVQPALRNLMEDYSETVRFILTCNYRNKIIPPLHSRCQGFHIARVDHTEFIARVARILLDEQIEFDLDVLDTYVKTTYPDMRKCLNLLQPNCHSGKLTILTVADINARDWKYDCVNLFKQRDYRAARTMICQQVGPDEIDDIFRWMYDNLELWGSTPEQQDQAIIVIRNGLVNHSSVMDVEINLSATLCELAAIAQGK